MPAKTDEDLVGGRHVRFARFDGVAAQRQGRPGLISETVRSLPEVDLVDIRIEPAATEALLESIAVSDVETANRVSKLQLLPDAALGGRVRNGDFTVGIRP
jgi:hypothetical protein